MPYERPVRSAACRDLLSNSSLVSPLDLPLNLASDLPLALDSACLQQTKFANANSVYIVNFTL